jgi:hypothetical protein
LFFDVVEEFNGEDFPPYKVPIVAPLLPLERTELMLAWRAAYEEKLNTYYQSVDHSSSIIGDKMYAEIMVVLANQGNYWNKCKAMIRSAKHNMELLKEASVAKALKLCQPFWNTQDLTQIMEGSLFPWLMIGSMMVLGLWNYLMRKCSW